MTKHDSDMINIRVIKDDTRYYYIINGIYEFSVNLDWLGGKTCPGLYSLGAAVEFSNWQVTDYEGSDKDEAFAELLGSYQWTEKVENVSPYTGDGRRAPKPTDAAHKDWLFAGWYEDAACTVISRATEGSAYAKFLPAELLSVRCQILAGTSKEKPSDMLRIISTVDSLDYNQVGFDITVNGVTKSYGSTKVYEVITAKEGDVAVGYGPKDFHENAKYFATGTLVNIPVAASGTAIQITPWWKTLDGTKVCGVGRYSRVVDFYDGVYNVPIRLYSEGEAAAGYLEVIYNNEVFQYVGMDQGNVFDEMEVRGEDGIVRCVGHQRTITADTGNVKAEGMYVNLRFQLIPGKSVPTGETFFQVPETGRDFCDNQEVEKEVYVPDGVYRNISK